MTRIVSGSWRGRRLDVPPRGTRPTSERVREAIFSKLDSYDCLAHARILDLFAGSGALGLEALSRGGESADFVDASQGAIRTLSGNIRRVKAPTARVHRRTAQAFLGKNLGPWDLVFLDPPYDFSTLHVQELLTQLSTRVSPHAWIVVERSVRSEPLEHIEGWEEWKRNDYGETCVFYARVEVDT